MFVYRQIFFFTTMNEFFEIMRTYRVLPLYAVKQKIFCFLRDALIVRKPYHDLISISEKCAHTETTAKIIENITAHSSI